MGKIVFAAGVPHAPTLVGLLQRAPDSVQNTVRDSFAALKAELVAAKPDVVIVFANDHLVNSRIRSYPDFLIGMADEHRGPHDWFKPWIGCRDYAVKGDRKVAGALLKSMLKRKIRMFGESGPLRFDDNISVPAVMTDLDTLGIPLVPVLQNCVVPPVPDQHRCYEVGRALAEFIRSDLPPGMRVALIGSGGLSHEPGGARYYTIDDAFDRWFMDLVASGDHQRMLKELTFDRMEAAGSGGTAELLAWVVIMGAIGECTGRNFGYASFQDFRCGFGMVIWDLDKRAAERRAVEAPPAKPGMSGLTDVNPALATHDLVQDVKWDAALRERFTSDQAAVLDRYPLEPEERAAIERRDFRALYDMGMHPYLGGQLARLIYGNEAGKGAITAVNKLLESLRRQS